MPLFEMCWPIYFAHRRLSYPFLAQNGLEVICCLVVEVLTVLLS